MATRPAYGRLLRATRNRTASALLAVVFVTVVIIVPAGFILNFIVADAIQALAFLKTPDFRDSLQSTSVSVNAFAVKHGFGMIRGEITGTLQRLLNVVASALVSLLTESLDAITQIVSLLFLLFFAVRDGSRLRHKLYRVAPYSRSELRGLSRRVRDTVEGTLVGRVIVASIQGVLAWAVFWSLSIPVAALLGSLTAVCAIFPAIGAYFVWLPVMLYMVLMHAWTRAVILLVLGSTVLSTVDNFLFPVIAGKRTRMATAPMFLSLFGGVWAFGISGLILGPVIWSVADALISGTLKPLSPEPEQ